MQLRLSSVKAYANTEYAEPCNTIMVFVLQPYGVILSEIVNTIGIPMIQHQTEFILYSLHAYKKNIHIYITLKAPDNSINIFLSHLPSLKYSVDYFEYNIIL